MKRRIALCIFWLLIWAANKIVQAWLAWCIVFNPDRATEIALGYDRVGNAAMGRGDETISSWAGRHNDWTEPWINRLFKMMTGEDNHCDANREPARPS